MLLFLNLYPKSFILCCDCLCFFLAAINFTHSNSCASTSIFKLNGAEIFGHSYNGCFSNKYRRCNKIYFITFLKVILCHYVLSSLRSLGFHDLLIFHYKQKRCMLLHLFCLIPDLQLYFSMQICFRQSFLENFLFLIFLLFLISLYIQYLSSFLRNCQLLIS